MATAFAYPPHLPPRKAIETAVEVLLAVLDATDGDADAEPDFSEDDAVLPPWWGDHRGDGAGCPISDPAGCEHDGREPDDDVERETWAHWMDHPAELHIGKRPGHTDEAA